MSEIMEIEKGTFAAPGSSDSTDPVDSFKLQSSSNLEEQKYQEELRISAILRDLLDQHKAQSLVVQGLKVELDHLDKNPKQYFESRKKFLYHAYTQSLKDWSARTTFDVKSDARYALEDKEIGLVFGHIYQINPHEALEADFTLEVAAEIDREAGTRVAEWQTQEGLPEGHSSSLYDIGKRILKGHVGIIETPLTVTVADTEHLVTQAKELQIEEERLKTAFPTATKAMDPDDGQSSASEGNDEHCLENDDKRSESSGVLVSKEDFNGSQESLRLIEGSERRYPKLETPDKTPVSPSDGDSSKTGIEAATAGKMNSDIKGTVI